MRHGVIGGITGAFIAVGISLLAQATWTTPRTWVTGEVVGAGQFNTHVRDNLQYLYANGVPSGLIAHFTGGTCPTGWTAQTSLEGRYLVGLPAGGTDGATVGTALTNTENRAVGRHTHTQNAHNHGITDTGHTHTFNQHGGSAGPFTATGTVWGNVSGNTGNSTTGITINNRTATNRNAGSVSGTNAPYEQRIACAKD